jgi:hypothetical protein
MKKYNKKSQRKNLCLRFASPPFFRCFWRYAAGVKKLAS